MDKPNQITDGDETARTTALRVARDFANPQNQPRRFSYECDLGLEAIFFRGGVVYVNLPDLRRRFKDGWPRFVLNAMVPNSTTNSDLLIRNALGEVSSYTASADDGEMLEEILRRMPPPTNRRVCLIKSTAADAAAA